MYDIDLTIVDEVTDPLLSILLLTVVVFAKECDVTDCVNIFWVCIKLREHLVKDNFRLGLVVALKSLPPASIHVRVSHEMHISDHIVYFLLASANEQPC